MSAQHTPTPWHDEIGAPGSASGLTVRDENGNIIARVGSIDDAAFIVRACNAHDELRDLAEAIRNACEGDLIVNASQEDTVGVLLDAARAALAKAGAA